MRTIPTAMLMAALPLSVWAEGVSGTLSLDAAIDHAIQGSPALAAANATLQAAEGIERQSVLLTNPELSLEAENLAGSGAYQGTDAAEYTYSLSQKLELGGKRASRRGFAGAETAATRHALQSARLDLIRDVTVAYAEVLAAEQKQGLAEKRQKLAHEVLTHVSRRVGAARDPLVYQSQADIALATATLAHHNAERDVRLARRKLASLWGEETLSQKLDAAALDIPAPEPLDVYRAALDQNPGLRRYNDVRHARREALKLEKAQAVPDPAVSIGLRDFRETGHQAMVVGVSFPIPVLNRNQGNIARAQAEVAQTEHEGRQARLDAEQRLAENWQEWQSAQAEETELEKRIIPAALKALALSRQGFDRGRFSFLEVLSAQRTLAEAQEQSIEARRRGVTANAEVARLTATALTLPSSTLPAGDR